MESFIFFKGEAMGVAKKKNAIMLHYEFTNFLSSVKQVVKLFKVSILLILGCL